MTQNSNGHFGILPAGSELGLAGAGSPELMGRKELL